MIYGIGKEMNREVNKYAFSKKIEWHMLNFFEPLNRGFNL